MRHRAALGIAEQSDAVVIIVSEETGEIGYAFNAKLNLNVSTDELRTLLSGGIE
jgi:diadenylate cyclase